VKARVSDIPVVFFRSNALVKSRRAVHPIVPNHISLPCASFPSREKKRIRYKNVGGRAAFRQSCPPFEEHPERTRCRNLPLVAAFQYTIQLSS